MESSQYFIAKSDKYVLVRKIGNRFFRIISDTNIDLYGNISIFSFNKGNDSTLPK